MDFYEVRSKTVKGRIEVYPEFIVDHSDDLMVRGKDFYAIWDEDKGLWNTKRMDARKAIDKDIRSKAEEITVKERQKRKEDPTYQEKPVDAMTLWGYSSNQWEKFLKYMASKKDDYVQLDTKIAFQDTPVKKKDYISRRLSYSPAPGNCDAWETLISTLYEPEEREKIEWAIGSILTGESRKIQKFLVFFGPQGTGKGTILSIIMKLFDGYYSTFKAENLVRGDDQFNLDFLASNPLLVIDADSKLNKIESNATLNKLVSHEQVQVNEKFKGRYPVKPICMLMLGTNYPVKITDAKSGIIRRLIDIEPSGRLILPESRYDMLMEQVEFELGAIAWHCMEVFKGLGRSYYSGYVPERMMYRTDAFFNFMEEKAQTFIDNDGVSANDLWNMWKDFCQQSGVDFTRKRFEIIDEAKNYFQNFDLTKRVGNIQYRSWFSGLKTEKFHHETQEDRQARKRAERISKAEEEKQAKMAAEQVVSESVESAVAEPAKDFQPLSFGWLKMDQTKSLLDELLKDYPAQYEIHDESTGQNRPEFKWEKVKTTLKDLDTSRTHYIRGLGQLICIDFDIRNIEGVKDAIKNLEAAGSGKWKPTYAEFSNSGKGIHLYYWYDGDISQLSSIFSEDIEIKVYPEDSLRALRRRVTYCNDLPIAHISSGLPLKEKKVINWEGVKDDRHLRNMILQAIKKECRPYGEEPKTVTCVKWIGDILQNAQEQGMNYDVRDLGEAIYAFAAHSSHNKEECIKLYYDMELMWPKEEKPANNIIEPGYDKDAPIIILDCEVIRNVTLVVYKELEPDGVAAVYKKPKDIQKKCVRMFNPKPRDIEQLLGMKIVGHNVTGYDNYILWALWLGYTPEQIFQVSQDIIVNGNRLPWREAKNVSYTDTYDVSSEKKGLKKIEIEMHIPHKEMEIDWSKDLPESEWERLAQYCENDVLATEAYFLSKKWQADFKARKIQSELTGLNVNTSTNNQSAQIIFGDVKEPWHEFNYPDLKKMFPEYRFENGKSYYGDELVGEGGRVYAEPGSYYDVITFDVASMHPTSIIVENGFGPYTKNYADLYEARLAIKHKDYEKARKLFNGRLAPYLENDKDADDLSYALKIVLNSVYGMTAAPFQNRFRDPKNRDNWVAKRGALFMEKLRREVQKRGGHVIHIKTDSIKLVKPSQELKDFVIQFGKDYGYTFEIESHYERICLVNNAVYIALRAKDDPGWLKECKKAKEKAEETETPYIEPTRWTATGAQFAHPFVFKKLFSRRPMDFWDFCETKTVKTSLYLDMNENLPDVSGYEKEKAKIASRIKKLKKELLRDDITVFDKEKITNELNDLPNDIAVLDEEIAKGHHYVFVGKAGEFMPVLPGSGGGLLMRKETDGSYGYATGAKGFRWVESESMQNLDDWKKYIDIRYFRGLSDVAIETINQFDDFELFVKGDDSVILPEEQLVEYETDPWTHPCKTETYAYCSDCPEFENRDDGSYFCKQGYDISNQILGESKETLV